MQTRGKTITSLIFGISGLSCGLFGIIAAVILAANTESIRDIASYFFAPTFGIGSAVAFGVLIAMTICVFVTVFFAIGFGIVAIVLNRYALQQSRMKLLSLIFGIAALVLAVISLLVVLFA